MNTDYIRSLLIMFNNRSIYEIETALLLYEFMDCDMKNVTDTDINRVYKLVRSQDEIISDSVREEMQKELEKHEKEQKSKEEELER